MKKLQRPISLLLAAIMLLGALPMQALAADPADNSKGDVRPRLYQNPSTDYIAEVLGGINFELDEDSVATALGLPEAPLTVSIPNADDELAFSGGEPKEDPYTDLYTINMGKYSYDSVSSRFPLTITRPKGDGCNYDISVDFRVLPGSFYGRLLAYASADTEKDITEINSILFKGGESSKTIYIDYPSNISNIHGKATVYIDFHYGYRTKTQQRLVQLVWDCTYEDMGDVGDSTNAYATVPEEIVVEDGKALIPISVYFNLPVRITEETRLHITPSAKGAATSLPAQEVEAVTQIATFLYVLEEDSIGTVELYPGGNTTELFSISELTDFYVSGGSTEFEKKTSFSSADAGELTESCSASLLVRPQYGEMTLDADSVQGGQKVVLTAQIDNAALLARYGEFTKERVSEWFCITVDGGRSLVISNSALMAVDGTVTLEFNAPVNTGEAAQTYYAEVMEVSKEEGSLVATAILGKFCSFTVSTEAVDLVPATGFSITGLPKGNLYSKGDVGKTFQLGAEILPIDATYKDITWGSSDPGIASIDSMGRLKIHKEGIVEITAFTGELKYLKDRELEPNEHAGRTEKIFIGDAAPLLLPNSSYSETKGYLRFATLDNFHLAIPSDAEQARAFLAGMHVGYEIRNSAGNTVASREPKALDSNDSEVRLHLVPGLEGTALSIVLKYDEKHGEDTALVRENSVYKNGELQPAYTAEVTVSWPVEGGSPLYPEAKGTYQIFVSPPWLTVDMAGWRQSVVHLSDDFKPTVTVGNLSPLTENDAWEVRYELQRDGHPVAGGSMNCGSSGTPANGIAYNRETNSATISLNPPTNTAGRLTLTVSAKNTIENDSATWWNNCDIVDPTEGKPVSITAFGKTVTDQTFGGNFDREIVSRWKNGAVDNADFVAWLEQTKPLNTVQITAPDSWGEAKINGREFPDWRSFGVNMKNKKPGNELVITWDVFPNHAYKVDYLNSYTDLVPDTQSRDAYDLYIFDFDPSITSPITFHTLDGAGNKYEYATKTPHQGRVALLAKRDRMIAESDASPFRFGLYMTATLDGEQHAGFVGAPAKANWVGSPEQNSIVYSLADAASHGGYFVSNRIRLDKERILRITAPGHTAGTGIQAAVIDAGGEILSGALPTKATNGMLEINCFPILADEDCKLLIELTDPITGSRLEVIDQQRLKEIVGDSGAHLTDYVIKPRYQEGSVFHGAVSETGGFSSLIMRRTVTLPEDSRGERTEQRTEDLLSRGYIQGQSNEVPPCYIIETESPSFTVCARVDKDADTGSALTLNATAPIADSVAVYDCGWLNSKYVVASYPKSVVDWSMQSNGLGKFQGYFELRLGTQLIDRVYTTLSTTDDEKVGKWFSLILAQDSAREAARMSTPSIESTNHNLDTSHGSSGFSKYKMNMPKDMNYNFYVTQSESDPNLYTIRGAVSLTQSINEPLAPFESLINKAADSEKEINDIIADCRNTVKNGPGFSFSVETDTPFSYSSTIKSYIIAKGIYNPETGKMQLYFQEGGMKGEINAGYSQSIPIAGLFEMGFGIEGGYSISLIQSAPSKEELQKVSVGYSGIPMNNSIENEMSIKLTVKAGVVLNTGFVKLSVGAGGSGTIAYFDKVVRRPYLANSADRVQSGKKVRGTAEAFVYSSVGILFIDITVEYTIAKGSTEWLLPDSAENVYHKDNPAYVETLSLMGDQREAARLALYETEAAGSEVADGLHSSAAARYVSGSLLYNDINEWDNYNDDAIAARGGAAISPDLSHGQYAFDAAYAGTHSVAVWEQLKEEVGVNGVVDPLDLLREQLTKTEIVVATSSGSGWTNAIKLSDNNVIDMGPRAAVADEENAAVIWKRGILEQPGLEQIDALLLADGDAAEERSDVDKALELDGRFELVFSKYNGTSWSEPEVLYRPAEGRSINSYSLACDTDGGLVAAVALTPNAAAQGALCDIEYISVDKNNEIMSFTSPVKGVNPQLARIGTDYFTGIYTERTISGEVPVEDDKGETVIEAVTETVGDIQFGKLSADKPGVVFSALGLPATVGAEFRFAAGPANLADLGIVYPVIGMDAGGDENTASLVAAKIFHDGGSGRYYTGPAMELALGASATSVRVASYDAKLSGGNVSAIAILAGVNANAVLVESAGQFADAVRAETSYKPSDLAPKQGLPVNFMLKNDSQRVFTKVEIAAGGNTIFTDNSVKLLPNQSKAFSAECMLLEALPPALDYTVTLTDDSGGTLATTGSIALAQGDLSLELLSLDEKTRKAVVLIGDESQFGLQQGDQVTVGLYRDIEGKTPVSASSVVTLDGAALTELKGTGRAVATLGYSSDMDNQHIFAVVKAANDGGELWDIAPENNVGAFMPVVKKTTPPRGNGTAGGTSSATGQVTVADTVVTYPKGSEPVKNADGSITLPNGGSIEVEPGIVVTAPAGTVVNANGSVSLPAGKSSEVAITGTSTVVTLTNGGGVSEKGVISVTNGAATLKNNLFNIALEAGETLIPDPDSLFGFKRAYGDGFADVPADSWYARAVRAVFEAGIMNGVGDGEFAPDQELSRAMLVQILHNLQGRQSTPASDFADVQGDAWYANAVAWAAANGIVNGYDNGTFGPDDSITREQMAVVLYRFCLYMGISLPAVREAQITDLTELSDWAVEAVEAMFKAGILSGRDNGAFDPKATATRAEVAQMLLNFLNAIE